MEQVAGITTHTDSKGKIMQVTIDVERYREVIMPLLQQLGVVEKSDFMKEFETCIPLAEAEQHTLNFARSLWPK